MVSFQDVSSQEKKDVTITITQTSSYCGGAEPPTELMKQLRTPKPLIKKVIYVRKGEKNKTGAKDFIIATSDSAGKIKIKLQPGKYYLTDERKAKKKYSLTILKKHKKESNSYSSIDVNCLKEWLLQPDLIFEVSDTDNKFSFNYHQPCSWNQTPCVKYKGEYPP